MARPVWYHLSGEEWMLMLDALEQHGHWSVAFLRSKTRHWTQHRKERLEDLSKYKDVSKMPVDFTLIRLTLDGRVSDRVRRHYRRTETKLWGHKDAEALLARILKEKKPKWLF